MAVVSDRPVLPRDVIEPLELLIFGAVGITTVALAAASAGELTLSQWRALVVIGKSERVRIGEIATAVGTSLPSVSRLVRRLERRGLVTTERDEADRRATLVRMTGEGRHLTEEVFARRRALLRAALDERAPRLPGGLVAGLDAIAGALDRYE